MVPKNWCTEKLFVARGAHIPSNLDETLNCQIYIRVNEALLKQSVTLLAMKLNVKHNIRKQEKNHQMKAYYSYVATQYCRS